QVELGPLDRATGVVVSRIRVVGLQVAEQGHGLVGVLGCRTRRHLEGERRCRCRQCDARERHASDSSYGYEDGITLPDPHLLGLLLRPTRGDVLPPRWVYSLPIGRVRPARASEP